jgi:hypothetical protein
MAAAEQLKELGEKLQAPAPADELAKLLEVRYPQASPFWLAANIRHGLGGVGGGFAWICGSGGTIRQV